MLTRIVLHILLLAILSSLTFLTFSAQAQDSWDEDGVTIYIKKIRDEESNYLRDVTRATAREVSKSGEFIAKPHKRSVSGSGVEISRTISYEQVFDSKSEFLAKKESLIQDAIVGEVKKS